MSAAPKLGLSTFALAWAVGVPGYEQPAQPLDVISFLHFTDQLGLRLVQIADNLPLDKLSGTDRQRLRDEARRLGIAIEVGTRGIQTEHLRQYLDIARQLESPILRVVVDTKDHRPTPDEVVSLARAILPELEASNITLAIENHDRFKVRALEDIIKTVGSPNVGICLDTVNSFGSLEGPEVVVEALGPYVVNLHLKEFVVKRAGHAMGFEITGRPAGQGMLDVAWLLNKLNGFGRSYNSIIEAWLPMQITLEETMMMERRWAEQSATYLRQYIKD
jgi:sugar phosphate isomerase/epimerase